MYIVVFFFKQKTAYDMRISDWSSDVCSSDLVRAARKGERLRLLNGDDAELDAGFLAITDADRVVGLAGVMVGDDTKVGASTRHVFLEGPHFATAATIGHRLRLGLPPASAPLLSGRNNALVGNML